ncbi:MAG: hypothetical protein JTT11_09865 [Candidatus Brockarchaeota archaeon]|nr:hypothetical protein [Candidatus Brockarchaeota archaeon]
MKIGKILKIIENEFIDGRVKQMSSKEMIENPKKKGFKRIDIDDALDEAERRKIVAHVSGFYKWIDPSLRKLEMAKTQRRFQAIDDIFEDRKNKFLPQEDLVLMLKKKGFDDEEIKRTLIEAERDYILRFSSRSYPPNEKLVPSCTWIPPKDRKKEAEADRHQREWFEKQLEKYEFEDERWG